MDVKPQLLFSLGCHSKQASNERHLIGDVPFFHIMYLPLPNHIHALVGCVARKKGPLMIEQNPFKWRHFQADVILLCVRWYLRYSLSSPPH
jgi:hypothetical protein